MQHRPKGICLAAKAAPGARSLKGELFQAWVRELEVQLLRIRGEKLQEH